MNELPLVTVNILSYNRRDELRITLTKVFEQDYKNIEVIVVDNASADGSAEMVEKEYPSVKLIKLEKNIGIAGWNEGFNQANGEYVLVLDDDSYPEYNAILEAVKKFSSTVGIVALNIINIARNISETESFSPPFLHFVGCGALIKKTVFIEVGGFDPALFIYCHENDFAIRVYNEGYKIEYSDKSKVIHRASSSISPILNKRYFFYTSLNNLLLNHKYLSKKFYPVTFKYLINRILVAIYYSYFNELIKAVNTYKKVKSNIPVMAIHDDVLKLFNYRLYPIFDREYFGNMMIGRHKLVYPVLYIKYLFAGSEKKKEFVR